MLGFGFVRFGEQSEQMISLTTMQGRVGLGDRPMKVSIAYVKGKDGQISYPSTQPEDVPADAANSSSGGEQGGEQGQGDYAAQWEQYNQYWTQYAAWQQYYAAQGQTPAEGAAAQASDTAAAAAAVNKVKDNKQKSIFEGSLKEVVQNKSSIDYEALNQEYLDKSEELYTAIDESGWSMD